MKSDSLMDNPATEQLRIIPLFHGLPESELKTLAQKVIERSYTAGETIIQKGETGDSLFLIVDGMVKIVSENAQGGELILNQCGPGEAIGEMSLLDQAPRSATVIAVSRTKILELKHRAFRKILDQHPELALSLIRSISSRLRFATTYIEKAIDWSKHVADGDYSAAMAQIQTAQPADEETESDEVKADQLLSAFFQMVQGVKAREDKLKQELQKLTLEIDEARRKQQVQEVTGTDFYAHLKTQAAKLRRQREEEEQEE